MSQILKILILSVVCFCVIACEQEEIRLVHDSLSSEPSLDSKAQPADSTLSESETSQGNEQTDKLSALQVASYTVGVNLFRNSLFNQTKQILEEEYFLRGADDALHDTLLIEVAQMGAVLAVAAEKSESVSIETQSYVYGAILIRNSNFYKFKNKFDTTFVHKGIADEYNGIVSVPYEQLNQILQSYLKPNPVDLSQSLQGNTSNVERDHIKTVSYAIGIELFRRSLFSKATDKIQMKYFLSGLSDEIANEVIISDEQMADVLKLAKQPDLNQVSQETLSYVFGISFIRNQGIYQYIDELEPIHLVKGVKDEFQGKVDLPDDEIQEVLQQFVKRN